MLTGEDGQIPPEICALPDTENFKPIKDEIRNIVRESKIPAFRGDPRVKVISGWAWFDLKHYDDAVITHELLQGRFWSSEGITLECYVYDGDSSMQLLGPIETAIGVNRSPIGTAITGRHSGRAVSRKFQAAGYKHGHAGSNDHTPGESNVQFPFCHAPEGLNRFIQTLTILPTGYAGVGYPQRRQPTGPLSPIATTPIFSSSSRSSSVSTQSTVMVPPYIANSVFSATSGAHDKHLGSWDPSLSSVSVASTTSRSSGPIPTPPQSISEYDSEHPNPAAVHGHKVTIRNLGPGTTKERVYALIEGMTHAFVGLVQPDYIALRPIHGQFHAYVKFIREEDAKKAVNQLQGYKFMGRTLQATLG